MHELVTREGELFQVSDRRGDFVPEAGPFGLFARDTRYLSRLELFLDGERPELLGATATENYLQRVYLQSGARDPIAYQPKVGVRRYRLIAAGVMYERMILSSATLQPATYGVELRFGADFADLFEVRGVVRAARGQGLPAVVEPDRVTLGYQGLDGITRQTQLRFLTTPSVLTESHALWELTVGAREEAVLDILVLPAENGAFPEPAGFDAVREALRADYAAWVHSCTGFASDHLLWNRVLERAVLDLRLLTANLGHGPVPVAGIPWFAVPFGRDSLLTALQALPLNPDLARGTLRTMAALQGQGLNATRLEEPGKIPHEVRSGEMANLDEIPFRRYYGSVDSTPLFLLLVGEYYAWTGDLALVRELLPNIRSALRWLNTYGDRDGDGFVEYQAHPGGLVVQSWKDSPDSMSHRDGRPAASPVAVSEVQGYAYAARQRLVPVLRALGEAELAGRLAAEAAALKDRFNQAFWMEDRQFFAIALDGQKEQVGTVSSNIGHCLWAGIVAAEKAGAVARRLVSPEMFSGWGIRTLSQDEVTYSPMSYHNGSVWPHDNALCVLGLRRYGYDREAGQVMAGLIEAAACFADYRLPELFCGFSRDEGRPVEYPVACSPQAWAAAAAIALVQAILGLEPDAAEGVLRVRPSLPPGLGRLAVRGLRVGRARVDLEVTAGSRVAFSVAGEPALRVEVAGG